MKLFISVLSKHSNLSVIGRLFVPLSVARQIFAHLKMPFILDSVCTQSQTNSGTLEQKLKLSTGYWHSLHWSEVLTSPLRDGRRAGGAADGSRLEVFQEKDELTLSAACRWSNTAPASARQWGYHQWSTTGTPPRTVSRRLRAETELWK